MSFYEKGPVRRPWDAYTDDHLGVMDHLRIDKFMVLGFCIGGPFIWNLLKRAPNRVVAAVLRNAFPWLCARYVPSSGRIGPVLLNQR